MILTYSKSESLTVAVEQTFDGEHPCGMCKDISQSKKSEEKPASAKSDKKIESLAGASSEALFVFAPDPLWSVCDPCFIAGHADSPPVPPPRGTFC